MTESTRMRAQATRQARLALAARIVEHEVRNYPADSRQARLLAHARVEWSHGNYIQANIDLDELEDPSGLKESDL